MRLTISDDALGMLEERGKIDGRCTTATKSQCLLVTYNLYNKPE